MTQGPLRVWYDGQELTQIMQVTMGKDELVLPTRDDATISPGNYAGAFLQQAHWGSRTIETPFIIAGTNVRDKAKQLAFMLYKDEPKRLVFSDNSDRYWNAIPEGNIALPEEDVVNLQGTIKWICYDPYAHSTTEDKFTFSDDAPTQTITSDLANKVTGNLSVPHTVYQANEPIAAALSAPNKYTQEVSQAQYSAMYSHDNNVAQLTSSSSHTVEAKGIADDGKNGELGCVDNVTANGDSLTIRGWYATNESTKKTFRSMIITRTDWHDEIVRVPVTPSDRPDVGHAYPNVNNSGKSGFEVTIPYDSRMDDARLMIHFRYSTKENGYGDWIDYTALVVVDGTWRQTLPHFMIKVDVLQAIEQKQPGFWAQHGYKTRIEEREYLRTKFVKAGIQAFVKSNVNMQVWDNTDDWIGTQTGSNQLQYNYTTPDEFMKYVDANGYMYVNIYATTSAANVAVKLDYFSFNITVENTTSDSLTVINNGPMPVPIRFEMINNGQNGFLGIQGKGYEQILLGSPEQMDGKVVSKSERIYTVNQGKGLDQFILNKGYIGNTAATSLQTGEYDDPMKTGESRWRLRNMGPNAFGSMSDVDGWHGPSVHADFGKDSQGSTGATNFTARAYLHSEFGNMNQGGLQEVTLNGPNGEILVCVTFWKNVNSHNGVSIKIGDKEVYADNNNPRWDNFFGSVLMARHGNVYTITLEDVEGASHTRTKQTFTYTDATSAAIKATGFTYWKAHYGSDWYRNMWNDLYDFWINKDNVDSYVDIPNVFAGGDKVNINGDDGKVTTTNNGIQFLDWQDIGSQPVMAYPGTNIVSFTYSSFAQRPSVKAYIRKAYL